MLSARPTHAEFKPVSSAELIGAILAAGLVTYVAGPVLRHTDLSVIPWPVPGIVVAILFSVPPEKRAQVALGVLGSVAIGALAHSGLWERSLFAALAMVAQSISVLLLHQHVTEGRHPLRGPTSYAWFAAAALVGLVPIILLVLPFVGPVGSTIAPDYTPFRWWTTSVTSMLAVAPVLLARSAPHEPETLRGPRRKIELPILASVYALALFSAFFSGDASPFALPPVVATVPFLVWAGLRLGVRGYAVFVAMFVVVVVTATFFDIGPFSDPTMGLYERRRMAWIYLASLASPAMMVPLALAQRKVAEVRARAASAQLAAIIESSSDPIAAVDGDLTIIAANAAWLRELQHISSSQAAVGMHMADGLVGLPDDRDGLLALWRRALAGERFTITRDVGDPSRAREGYEMSFSPVRDARGRIVGASHVMRNVSERRRQELAEAEMHRLEALGRLAGGVAHDFNNLMAAVVGYTSILAHSMPADDPRQSDLGEIEKAATRAGGLTQQLLSFARRRVVVPRHLNVGEFVGDCMQSVAQLLGSAIEMQVRIGLDLPEVRIDPTQLEQAIMNLAVNALEAMPNGGSLVVTVERIAFRDGAGVQISIRDSGVGMPPEVVARIWEPFYTTKPMGRGTGLGLATVHGTIHQAGGDVEVESTPGFGSTFRLRLPAAA